MGEVALEHYRLQSLIGQGGMGKMSPHRAAHIIEPLACAQDGVQPQGFAKNSKNFPSHSPQPACESGSSAATTGSMSGAGESFSVYSSVTGETYQMSCMVEHHGSTTCRGGNDAAVQIF